jgi:hypothetical protein
MPAKTATKMPKVETAAKPIATPAATPAAKPVATPAATPVAKPVATPTATPTAKPEATPVATPVAKPVATLATKPVAKPAAKPEVKVNDGDADDEEEVKLENKDFYVKKLEYYNIKYKEYQEKLSAISNKIEYYKEIIDEL